VSDEQVRELFAASFGGAPAVVASAPGRVNLIGEHTDYNGGEVLPIAIGRRTYVAARRNDSATTRLVSATQGSAGAYEAASPARSGGWWDYVAGVAADAAAQGAAVPGCDVAVWSDVPTGAGLSSSAALSVASSLALGAVAGGPPGEPLPADTARDAALAAFRAETGFVGVAVGIMDQFASALGRDGEALHLWCETADFEHVPMREAVLIFDTAVPRSLRSSAFNTRRAECERALEALRRTVPGLASLAAATPEQVEAAQLPAPLGARARHVATETRRVRAAVADLKAGRPLDGGLLLASHASLRDDYECSSPELDWFVEHAVQADGVRGARLTGAGWGGCAIAVGDPAALEAAAPALAAKYAERFGHAARVWHTRAARGAAVEAAT
jgi:galactokinase